MMQIHNVKNIVLTEIKKIFKSPNSLIPIFEKTKNIKYRYLSLILPGERERERERLTRLRVNNCNCNVGGGKCARQLRPYGTIGDE